MNWLLSYYYRHARGGRDSGLKAEVMTACSPEAQAKALAVHLEYCRKNIPMYQDIIVSGSNPFECLAQVPVFDKRKYSAATQEASASGMTARIDTTSGTSGQSFAFRVGREELAIRKEYEELANRMLGLEPGKPYLQIWGGHESESLSQRLKNRIYDRLTGRRLIIVKGADEQSLRRCGNAVRAHTHGVLITYPSILHGLCRNSDLVGALRTYRSIILTGEAVSYSEFEPFGLHDNLRNRYGSREFGVIAVSDMGAMRYFGSKYVLEIDPDYGLLVTDLSKKAMPMLRYPIGDFVDNQCRDINQNTAIAALSHLGRLEGRVMDVLKGRSGTRYVGTFWTLTLRKKAGVSQFRLIQQGQQLEVHYVGAVSPDQLRHVLTTILKDDFDLVITQRDNIPELKNAKQKIVENRSATDVR